MTKLTEEEFCAQYEKDYVVQQAAKAVYRELHPTGMRTNGPSRVSIPTSHVSYLLGRWRASNATEVRT